MVYTDFGRISQKVSRFGMGCMRYPQMKNERGEDVIDEQEAIKMIRYAIDHGVNYFDTAYCYPGSEAVLGKALKDGYREKVMIATKSPVWECKNHEDYRRLFEEQLERLQTNFIDVYILHGLDRSNYDIVKATDGIRFMKELKESGRIGAVGFSSHAEIDLFKEIIDVYDWDMCLIQLNILDGNHQAGLNGLRYAADKGIPVVIMEPLKGGILGKKPPVEVEELLRSYPEQRSLPEWAFRWLYDQN
ncbi:MAG: aldo/keto reductase, partial [Clostridia bacterium]|nr:aldo/keto reductase [Clostridia bacterium]